MLSHTGGLRRAQGRGWGRWKKLSLGSNLYEWRFESPRSRFNLHHLRFLAGQRNAVSYQMQNKRNTEAEKRRMLNLEFSR